MWTPRILVLTAGLAVLTLATPLAGPQDPVASQSAPTTFPAVQITSPRGRTGLSGPTRIVARIQAESDTTLGPVDFYVNGKLVGRDDDGAPYAVEWKDDDPFAPLEISVAVTDSRGRVGRDTIALKPYEFVFTSSVLSIYLEPSVTDKTGRVVNGLTAADFNVLEDGVPQAIDMVLPDEMPVTYTLLIDSSNSMSRRMDFVRDAARSLVEHLRAHDQVIIAPFSTTVGPITGPSQDRATITGAIDAIKSGGGTAILNSLVTAATKLSVPDTRSVVVLITDGYDENSDVEAARALDAVKSANATIYVVAIGGVAGVSLKGEALLKRLTGETSGKAFFPAREFQLTGVYGTIAADVQQRYLLTYTPTNQVPDGTWRAVTVTTNTPTEVVHVRPGYTAPSPPPIQPQIELTARDVNRHPVDVSLEDLIVFEDGVEQKVEAFEESILPVSVILALDSSGSMRADAAQVVEAARSFVLSLPSRDSLGVMTFADRPVPLQGLSFDRLASMTAISQYKANGGTALYDAVGEAAARLEHVDGRRAIVVLTDGRDENNPGTAPGSVRTLTQVSALVKENNVSVYAIGLGPKVDRATLETLAQVSGGESYFPESVSTLPAEYRRVLEDLRRRFVIRYRSTNGKHDGGWRAVEVRSRREGIVITSQSGYRAPGKYEK
jgi:Ca-activated chloride channel family protein